MADGSGGAAPLLVGEEWIVEARGCAPAALAELPRVRDVAERVLAELELRIVGSPQWHQFDGPAGVTGLYLLAESHLAVHTFPEHGLATWNLYCCRKRPPWPWRERLAEALGARDVRVTVVERG